MQCDEPLKKFGYFFWKGVFHIWIWFFFTQWIFLSSFSNMLTDFLYFLWNNVHFYTPVSRRSILCDWVWRAGGRPHRFPHNNFNSVYLIFTKLGHMIPLWKRKNPIYFGVIRSKVKVTITINRIFDNRVVSTW